MLQRSFTVTWGTGSYLIFATTTKICSNSYYTTVCTQDSLQAIAPTCSNSYYTTVCTQDSLQAIAPTYTLHHRVTNSGKVSVARLSAIHFQGWSIRQVKRHPVIRSRGQRPEYWIWPQTGKSSMDRSTMVTFSTHKTWIHGGNLQTALQCSATAGLDVCRQHHVTSQC